MLHVFSEGPSHARLVWHTGPQRIPLKAHDAALFSQAAVVGPQQVISCLCVKYSGCPRVELTFHTCTQDDPREHRCHPGRCEERSQQACWRSAPVGNRYAAPCIRALMQSDSPCSLSRPRAVRHRPAPEENGRMGQARACGEGLITITFSFDIQLECLATTDFFVEPLSAAPGPVAALALV